MSSEPTVPLPTQTADRLVPLAQATLLYRLTRVQLLARIQRGEIEGELRGRFWFVAPPIADQPTADAIVNEAPNAKR